MPVLLAKVLSRFSHNQAHLKMMFYSTYEVTCVSVSAATLQDTEADTDAAAGSTSFSKTFTSTDGVVAGTTYECSVKLTKDGYTSAKSPPVIIVTPDAAGWLILADVCIL